MEVSEIIQNLSVTFDELMSAEITKNFYRCNSTMLHKPYPNDGGLYCNATFDGYDCWDYTIAGSRTYGKCPQFLEYQFGENLGLPYKDCNSDGTWYRHPETGLSWTNYLPCSDTDKVRRAKYVLYVYFSGYGFSIVSLILSLGIFLYFRQLRCARVTIHKHLFLSYIITAILWISYHASSAFDPQTIVQNPVWCKVLHVLAQYVTMCNYAWMLCEGFYLHTILVWTFSNETVLLTFCYILGWLVPLIPTIVYSVFRGNDTEKDKNCWHEDTYYKWIFTGPITISLVINFIFLLNVLRILCSKVLSPNRQDSHPVRQTLRATLILIPLFGIQCFLIPNRPDESAEHKKFAYDIASAAIVSFQGLLVALLFCCFNGDVRKVLFLVKHQCKNMKRRMSRIETGKSYVNSTVQHGIGKGRTSTHVANQKVHSKDDGVDFDGQEVSSDFGNSKQKTSNV